ncbi:glycerate kinase [Elusimicrobium simillimum]|uniref:glycerate kinase n=1 Tax=Elusimicrobium simillimum TaxID=3143438 RepID=UPI003C6F7096
MKTLILANAFKGSLTALKAGKIIQRHTHGAARLRLIADGGDGIIEVFFSAYPKAKIVKHRVQNAYGVYHTAPAFILPGGKTAIVETAKICGLGSIEKKDLNPLISTSYGVGEMIKLLAAKGVKNFYIGLGGVACNDGGAGMASAMGVQFLDKKNNPLPNTTAALLKLNSINPAALNLKGLKFYALTDVTNPILGRNGSAAVFGPQKSKTKAQVAVIDKALTNYVKIIKNDLGQDIAKTPGTGAAGAIATGLLVFFNAKFISGAEYIFEKLNIEAAIKKAQRVIITEGRLDAQTFMGKAPGLAVKLAKKHGKEVLFICGQNKLAGYKKYGINNVQEISAIAANQNEAIKKAEVLLPRLLKNSPNI